MCQIILLKYHNKLALCTVCSKIQHHFDNLIYSCVPVYIQYICSLTSSILLFISHPSFPPSYLIFSYFLCHLIEGRKQQWVLGEAADQFPWPLVMNGFFVFEKCIAANDLSSAVWASTTRYCNTTYFDSLFFFFLMLRPLTQLQWNKVLYTLVESFFYNEMEVEVGEWKCT